MAQEEKSHVISMDLLALLEPSGANIAVATTGTAYSRSFQIPRGANFGLEYRFTSPGLIDVTISTETGSSRPTTEGSADTTNFLVANEIEANITVAVLKGNAPAPVVGEYVRFKIKGNGSNDAGTELAHLRLNYTPAI